MEGHNRIPSGILVGLKCDFKKLVNRTVIRLNVSHELSITDRSATANGVKLTYPWMTAVGRFQNGRNFQEAEQSRKTALWIADLPGSWRLLGGQLPFVRG
jgi:hypothetical protein